MWRRRRHRERAGPGRPLSDQHTNVSAMTLLSCFIDLFLKLLHPHLCFTRVFRLTSSVAEHRRSVRPSRRTQGSRNPLRALAAREDVRQDFMAERASTAPEERIQTENSECQKLQVKCCFFFFFFSFCSFSAESKNSDSHRVQSEDSVTSHPAFSSLMLIHIKGQWRFRVIQFFLSSGVGINCSLRGQEGEPSRCVWWSRALAL